MTIVPQLESLSSLRLDKISKIDVSRNRLQTIESALAGWLAGEHRRVLDLSHNQVAALYCTVLYCTVLYCTVLYCTVLYCTCNDHPDGVVDPALAIPGHAGVV